MAKEFRREITYKGEAYQVKIERKYGMSFVRVYGITDVDESGAFADAWHEATGRRLQSRHYTIVEDDLRDEIIVACGYKFSRSNAWKSEWDYTWRNKLGKPDPASFEAVKPYKAGATR